MFASVASAELCLARIGPHQSTCTGSAAFRPNLSACLRPRATTCRSSPEDKSQQWPRVAEPDNGSSSDDAKWDEGSTVDEAALAKNRETFLLRLASLGFGAVLVGERVSGRGLVQALGHPTGIQLYEMDTGLGVLVGALLVGGLAPTKWIYSSVNEPASSVLDDLPALFGRLSCLGLAATITAEAITGKGVLGLLNLQTGTETLTEIEAGVVFLVLLLLTNLRSKPTHSS